MICQINYLGLLSTKLTNSHRSIQISPGLSSVVLLRDPQGEHRFLHFFRWMRLKSKRCVSTGAYPVTVGCGKPKNPESQRTKLFPKKLSRDGFPPLQSHCACYLQKSEWPPTKCTPPWSGTICGCFTKGTGSV